MGWTDEQHEEPQSFERRLALLRSNTHTVLFSSVYQNKIQFDPNIQNVRCSIPKISGRLLLILLLKSQETHYLGITKGNYCYY